MHKEWKFYNPTFEYEASFFDWESLNWAWTGHKFFAYDLIRNIQPDVVVELGTHKGTSFFSFCQAVKDAHLNTHVYAVDTWEGDAHAREYDESIYESVKNNVSRYYSKQKTTMLRMYFEEAVKQFKDKSVDILHIDGYHTYEAVSADFHTWIDKVSDKGIILFHDTHEHKEDFGVYRFWDELKKKYKTIEFSHSHGLGVLFKNPSLGSLMGEQQGLFQHIYESQYNSKVLEHIIMPQYEELKKEYHEVEVWTDKNMKEYLEIRDHTHHIISLQIILYRVYTASYFRIWQLIAGVKKLLLRNE